MSSLKRKDAPGGKEGPSKRAKGEKSPASKGEAKTASKSPKAPSSATAAAAAPAAAAPVISRLKGEEPLFPRGGGSVLSPLEHKQIQIQAKQDALFEQESETPAKAEKGQKKKKRKSTSKDGKGLDKLLRDEDAVKIESLNYKRLVKGSLVLGQVWEINDLDIVVSLPNNLTGHVSLTAVSNTLTKRVEAAAADDSDEDQEGNADVELRNIFTVGQYVRAYVISTIEDAVLVGKAKRRIELSLRPEEANAGLSEGDVVENSTVMAAVASVEDHGYVMDIGIASSKLRGFLSKKEANGTLQAGAVQLCLVAGKSANGKVIQLTTKTEKLGNLKEFPRDATTINTFLPGTVVDVLVSDVSRRGIVGKVVGSLDVTADHVHSGHGPDGVDLESKYKVGSKIRARVVCTFPEAKDPKIGISVLDHVASLSSKVATEKGKPKSPLEVLPISSLVESCTVKKVEADIGLFVDIGVKGVPGFVHISRVKDGKVDALYESSGPFKVGSVHRGRVVGYNPVDGVFHVSFEQNILDQPFLRLEDVPVGEVVNSTIEKLIIGENGVQGMIVKLSEGISGLVSEMHLSDVRLQHPEKKFREGMKVKARVLSTDLVKRQLRLTLKKTLVNSDAPAIKSFDDVSPGMQIPGTIVTFLKNGAIIQFYGPLRGFLPISEMSEAFIQDPKEHFRIGQVVTVHVLDVDADSNRLVVSCKDPSAFGMERQVALKNLKIGDVVSAKVSQKTEDDVFVELEGSLLKAILPANHLTDKSANKNQAALKKIHVGQTLPELVVLEKNEGRRAITVSQKPSLVAAAKDGKLLTSLEQAKAGDVVAGFVRNITPTAVFVQFAGSITALLPRAMLPQESQSERDFGLRKGQSLSVKIISVDREHGRTVVAFPSVADAKEPKSTKSGPAAANPVDETIQSIEDISVGKITKAKIISVKETQLNVKLADNIQGRIDVSEVFDSWDQISNRKNPLKKFRANEVVKVRVLGVHDAKKHRFLPITHRSTHSLLELSAKPSDLKADTLSEPLSLEKIEVGANLLAFVNNVSQNCLWVNVTPNVRGRIEAIEASDDLSLLGDLAATFPVGSALRVRVLAVDASQNRLDLSARSARSAENLTWDSIKQDLVLPGKITKVNERQIMVKLSEIVSGPVHLVDIADDYEQASTLRFSKNGVVRVSIVDLDKSNKRIRLSTRPSRILNSSLPVEDREIKKIDQLNVGDIVRGFVKNVADKGLFVNLGGDVTAMVKISDLSDSFLKDWKAHFQVDQLVKGRITSINGDLGQVQMSLKASVVEKDYVPLLTYSDFKVGQVVTGKVRAVEEFGAFILVDKSDNVSGLCHRSEMADKKVTDAKKLYSKDDVVKAVILKIDPAKKRISFGLKASYFEDEDEDMDSADEEEGAPLFSDEEDEESGDEVMLDGSGDIVITGTDNREESEDEDDEDDAGLADKPSQGLSGLDAGGFDWSGAALDAVDDVSDAASDAEADGTEKKKKKRRKPEIQVDRTAELDAHGPQTASDYERLLLGQPDSSELWIAYMAFQLQVSELSKAREIAERAIKTINIREETEKLNMWTAYLNLENAYGSDETLDEVFKRACQYNDEQEVYERLTSIYIQTNKYKKADDLFQVMVKKFGAKSPQVWTNYAHFLHNTRAAPDRARALLPRATQTLPSHTHLALTTKFAALEFRSSNGDPERGRTIFEGLLATYPKKFDLWNQLLDLEISVFAANKAKDAGEEADPATVRDVFERGTKVKGLKARRAKTWFQRWAKWEEGNGDAKSREKVSANAKEWAREAEARKKGGEADDEE